MNPPDCTRPIVVYIDDDRSRSVCSTLLRHGGYRVLEARNSDEAIARAREENAELVLADLPPEPRALFHRQIVEELPGVTCMFVHNRYTLDEFTRILGVPAASRDDSSPRN